MTTETMSSILVGEEKEWLAALPSFQQAIMGELLAAGVQFDDLGRAWLEAAVARNTAPFGATSGARVYYEKFLDELHDFLCSDDRYEAERATIVQGFSGGQATAVASVTAVISPALSAAPQFLAPAVAVVLCVVAKMGLNAWCKVQTERRSVRKPLDLN